MLWSSISQVQIYPIATVPTMGHETRVLTQDLYWPTLLTLFSSLSSCQTINWWKAYSVSGQQVSSADPGTAELMLDVDGANAARAFGACFSGVVVNVRESAAKSLPNRRRKTPENGGKRRRTAETAGTQHGMHPNTLRSCNSHDFATRNVGSGDAPWIPNLDYRKLYTTGAVLLRAEGVSIASNLFAEHGGHSYVVCSRQFRYTV